MPLTQPGPPHLQRPDRQPASSEQDSSLRHHPLPSKTAVSSQTQSAAVATRILIHEGFILMMSAHQEYLNLWRTCCPALLCDLHIDMRELQLPHQIISCILACTTACCMLWVHDAEAFTAKNGLSSSWCTELYFVSQTLAARAPLPGHLLCGQPAQAWPPPQQISQQWLCQCPCQDLQLTWRHQW